MPAEKPDWKEFGLFDDAELNLFAMEAMAGKLGIDLTDADRKEMKEIALERADLFTRLKVAVIANDMTEALRLGRELCGLPPANESLAQSPGRNKADEGPSRISD